MEDRLFQKLFDITDSLLDIRDNIWEIYEVLGEYINGDKGRSYCMTLLRHLDCPMRTMRDRIAKEKNVIIWPKASRVNKKILDLMKIHEL